MKKDLEKFIEDVLLMASRNELSYSDIEYVARTIVLKASHRSIVTPKQTPSTS